MSDVYFFIFDNRNLLNYILEFVTKLENLLVKQNEALNIDNFFKSILGEILILEIFLKGLSNTHSLSKKEFASFISDLKKKSSIPIFDFDKLIEISFTIFESNEIVSIIKKTIRYSIAVKTIKPEAEYLVDVLL